MRILFILAFIVGARSFAQQTYTMYVNPMVGTGAHGHTFPGVALPFGMVQLSPDTRNDGSWDGCSGYHYNDSLIYGFSHTHLSGTGCSDYGDILLMPIMRKPTFDRGAYPSRFLHKNEKSVAGYYSVKLKDDPIFVELTATPRVGFHKYTFTKEGSACVFLDLLHRDKLLDGDINVVDDKTIEVFRRSEAWAKDQYVYARVEFSKAIKAEKYPSGKKAVFSFPVKKGEIVMVKVAISQVDFEGAKKNMSELPGWDFEKTKLEAQNAWNKELSKIEVKSKNTSDLENFYTALYHCMIHPSLASDVDGRYRGADLKIYQSNTDHYTVFSLWDTFRALHPLFTIIEQKRTSEFVQTFIDIYKQSGMLPMWEVSSNETYCMIGYHSASVIADAMSKGIGKFDSTELMNALLKSSNIDKFGIKQYAAKGYLSAEDESESVSKTLEYSYDDWCIAQVAKSLKKESVYNQYMKRSQNWVNVYDSQTGFMRARFNGGWYSPFDPREVNNHYTEANSWQYSFFVPQNIAGLIQLSGGQEAFEKKLDQLFSENSKTTGREQADITGLIGQYAHGNEPSHHMAYLYNYVGACAKTQKIVHQILRTLYKPTPAGLCGNEDCGQISAWYVFSSMGFYPVTPGMPQYSIGTCLFDEVKINLENGNTFTINCRREKPGDFYLGSTSLSTNQFQSALTVLHHNDIMRGGVFDMNYIGDPQKSSFGKKQKLLGAQRKFLPAPVIDAPMIFRDAAQVAISKYNESDQIFYSVNKGVATAYRKPFDIISTTSVTAYAVNGNDTSAVAEGTFHKMKHPDWKITYNYKYNSQYHGGGDEALFDGVYGDVNWRKGFWQGFQGKDVEVVLDMGSETDVEEMNVDVLQDTRSWIIYPQKVLWKYSTDGKNFVNAGESENEIPADSMDLQKQELKLSLPSKVKARFIKVTLRQFGKLPDWHPGKGGDSFIFIDEVEVK